MVNEEKEFTRIFERLSRKYSSWVVWRDFIFTSAAAISNRLDKRPGVWHKRENEYLRTIKRYDRNERNDIPALLAYASEAIMRNPAQDFLGKLFMKLELFNHWKGQFFTPYSIADMMTRLTVGDGETLKAEVKRQGYIAANDPACGSGVTLIAFANYCRELGVDLPKNAFLVGQDIDETAALMCYIQLSVLNCAGLVIVGDTLTEPLGVSQRRPDSLWFTPAYFSNVWEERAKQ